MTAPPTDESVEISISTDSDVVQVRQVVREVAITAKLSLVDQTKLVTAASELARNTLVYGGGGTVTARILTRSTTGVEVVFHDEGPGIANVDLALTDGWTSGNGMGLGLSGARRLVDEFDLQTSPGAGTRIRVVKWRR